MSLWLYRWYPYIIHFHTILHYTINYKPSILFNFGVSPFMDISIYEPQVPDPTGSHFDPRPKLGTAHDAPFLPVMPISAQEAMIPSGVNGILLIIGL
jgi:hypothetical protein